MLYLRKDTSVTVPIGPFVDSADGYTPETGVTLGAANTAKIMKHNGGALTSVSANTFTHLENGIYNFTFTTTDTNTAGLLVLHIVTTAVHRPIRLEFMVLPPQVYDSLVAGVANEYLDVNVKQVSESATAADNLEAGATALKPANALAGSTATLIKTNLTNATSDHYNGRTITFLTGTLAEQSAAITDYNGATKELTVTQLTAAPSDGDQFVIS